MLIHCMSGAHRAGTAGTSWLLYQHKLDTESAIKLAKSLRRQIDP